MGKWAETNCNIGSLPHSSLPYDDDLIKQVRFYDVIHRRYTMWMSLLYDLILPEEKHPWYGKLTSDQENLIRSYNDVRNNWGLREHLFIFFVHRLTGSAVDYGLEQYGYGNSVLYGLQGANNVDEMIAKLKSYQRPKYSSKGYQIAAFPKIPLDKQSEYRLAGDHFICEIVPKLIDEFIEYTNNRSGPLVFRDAVNWLLDWNVKHGYRRFKFAYNCVIGDVAVFYPDIIDNSSMCELGPNAAEAIDLMIDWPAGKISKADRQTLIDEMVLKLCNDVGIYPYDVEDTACTFIHWLENHIDNNPNGNYAHIDMDKVFGSHKIDTHPRGRQKMMLTLGLIESFNNLDYVPTNTRVLDKLGISESDYKQLVQKVKQSDNV